MVDNNDFVFGSKALELGFIDKKRLKNCLLDSKTVYQSRQKSFYTGHHDKIKVLK